MSEQLHKLVVVLEAESSRLQSQLSKSNAKLTKWEKKASKSVNSVKKLFIGLAAAAAAIKFVQFGRDALSYADKIGKISDAVGLSTKSYQVYAHAASLAGIEQSQLNSNLTAFIKRVGEARSNTGPLVSFFKKYDTTLLQNIKTSRNQEEAMNLVADAIKNAGTKTDKAAIANAAFTRAGVVMTRMLNKGSAGLKEMKTQAEGLGIILDEQTIRQAEKASDALDIMSRVIKINLIKQIVKLSPRIIKLGNAFADALPKVTAFLEKLFDRTSISALENDLTSLTEKANGLRNELAAKNKNPISGWIDGIFGTTEKRQAKLDAITKQIDATVKKINAKRKELKAQGKALKAQGEILDLGSAAPDKITTTFETEFESLRKSLLDKETAEKESWRRRQAILDKALQTKYIGQAKYDILTVKLAKKHEDKLDKIQRMSMSAQHKMWESGLNGRLKVTGQILGSVSQLMQSENKKQFEIGKKAAIAQTLINTYAMAIASFKSLAEIPYVGWILGTAADRKSVV